jgi:hypothetical protein
MVDGRQGCAGNSACLPYGKDRLFKRALAFEETLTAAIYPFHIEKDFFAGFFII